MKKHTGWKAFDFGPESKIVEKGSGKDAKNVNLSNCKNKMTSSKVDVKRPLFKKAASFNFHKQLAPKSVSELAIHPKKIQEVEDWLNNNVVTGLVTTNMPALLLTGPTGSGKTVTVQVLCRKLGISITEWVNPMDIDYELVKGPNQVNRFLEFFTEAKYNSLFDLGTNKKIILVKDFPNVFIKHPEEFSNVLEQCHYKTIHPVVFICTEASSSKINLSRLLFPEEILLKYGITHYNFNACAPTLLKQVIKRAQVLVKEHRDLFSQPSGSTVEAILASSMGDIRSAVNQFYLASLQGCEDLPLTKSTSEKLNSKRKRTSQSGTLKNMVRDESLGLFHGLGRVLNPKRKEQGNSWRLNCDIEKLVDQFSSQPVMFTSFLFENYLKYFGDINDICNACEILSRTSQFLENWDNHELLLVALWISVLGVMVFNEHRVSKWNQIKGPRKMDKLNQDEKQLNLSSTDYFYYNLINKTEKYYRFNLDM